MKENVSDCDGMRIIFISSANGDAKTKSPDEIISKVDSEMVESGDLAAYVGSLRSKPGA